MEKSSKRGKIPQQDWPSIITRYEAGETLASIARTYDCSPPAISYIVSRTRARNAAAEAVAHGAPAASEPQLIKGRPAETPPAETPPAETPPAETSFSEAPAGEAAGSDSLLFVPRTAERPDDRSVGARQPSEPRLFPDEPASAPGPRKEPLPHGGNGLAERYGQGQREPATAGNGDPGNGSPGNGNPARSFGAAGGSPQNGEPRRTLHLSLPHGNEDPQGPDPQPQHSQSVASPNRDERFAPRPVGRQPGFNQPPRQAPGQYLPPGLGAPVRVPGEQHRGKDGGAFIDRALRERVDGDIAAFLAAFDAALDQDTPESRAGLREATDRLLRAGARTRIELERLEARAPLPARDKTGQAAPGFRQR